MNVYTKQKDWQIIEKLVVTKEEWEGGRGKLGVRD